MLNIIFHGITGEEFNALLPHLEKAMKEIKMHKDAVATYVPNVVVTSLNGKKKSMPFIELHDNFKNTLETIKKALRKHGIDYAIEFVLIQFVPEKRRGNID